MMSFTKTPGQLVALTTLVAATFIHRPAGAVEVLDYCLDHPEQCAISVHHVTEGWERHYNADRLQVTASTFKALTLIVYAQAVVDGRLDPERLVPKEEWARFWIGGDGGALARSWEGLDSPDRVTVDQMMRKMIEESDNASPDWLLNELGRKYFERVLGRYVAGYHDVPESIAAMFMTWGLNSEEPDVAVRMIGEYSGIDALGFKKEARSLFGRLRSPDFLDATRRTTCSVPPWESAAPSCQPTVSVTEAQARRVIGNHFVQSNARTYTRLLTGILERTLLPPAVQEIVERHFEWQLEIPGAAAVLSRAGTKGGDLRPQNVCNYVAYGEARATGERAVASVFLHDVPVALNCSEDVRPFELLEAILLEDGFKEELMSRLPEESPRPDLIARLTSLKRKSKRNGDLLKGKLQVRNIGPADAEGPFEVRLVASDDARVGRSDDTLETWVVPFLAADGRRTLRIKLKGLASQEGRFLFVRVDRKKEVDESNEDNNRPWEVLR